MNGMALRPIPTISLCSGGGMLDVGVDAGLRAVGYRAIPLCYVEREARAAATLVARMEEAALGRAAIWDDIETFPSRTFAPYMAGGIVVAGIPCQGHSLAGSRKLLTDERNLWPATRRIIRESGAGYFFLENVRGLLIPNRKEQLEAGILRVLEELAIDGWDAEWGMLSAKAVGANHRRERIFLLAKRIRNVGAEWAHRQRTGFCGNSLADDHGYGIRQSSGNSAGDGSESYDRCKDVAHCKCSESRTGVEGIEIAARCGWGGFANRVDEVPSVMGNFIDAGCEGPIQRQCNDTERREGQGRIAAGSGSEIPTTNGEPCSTTNRLPSHSDQHCTPQLRRGDITQQYRGQRSLVLPNLDGQPRERTPDGRAGKVASASDRLPVFAPARNDYAGWLRVLRIDPTLVPAIRRRERRRISGQSEESQSPVRLFLDGLAPALDDRADQLRIAGNGVVWQCAAAAFVQLWHRLHGG